MKKYLYIALLLTTHVVLISREWVLYPKSQITSTPVIIDISNYGPSLPSISTYPDLQLMENASFVGSIKLKSPREVFEYLSYSFSHGEIKHIVLDILWDSWCEPINIYWKGFGTTGIYYPSSDYIWTDTVEFTIPSSFLGAHRCKLKLSVEYEGIYNGADSDQVETITIENEFEFDYYMFDDGLYDELYVDNLDPSNPSIVDQLKNSNILAKWNGGTNKPLVIVEGFDPKNNNFPAWYYNSGKSLFDRARNEEGRDVYILNFAEGGNTMATSRNNPNPLEDDITYVFKADGEVEVVEYGNASVVQDAVRFVSKDYHAGDDIVLAGLSMGGVVCRYALAAAEDERANDPLPVSHFLSIDSPQQYATIDYDLMDFVFTQPLVSNELRSEYNLLPYDKRPSALSYHATLELLWNNPASHYNVKGEIFPSREHIEFYDQLNLLNGDNRGYPSKCKNLGVAFSSYNGWRDDIQGQDWLDLTIEAHGLYEIDYPGGSISQNFDFSGTTGLIEREWDKRICLPGSSLPLSHTNTTVYDESIDFRKSMLMGFLSFDAHLTTVIETVTNEGLQPTFIPFVSALDLYDQDQKDTADQPLLYPASTYLFKGESLNNDKSFNFSYAGNKTNYPDPVDRVMYSQDTGGNTPQEHYVPGVGLENDVIRVCSRFDQILFNREDRALGTNHDEFPDEYIDDLFDFINDRTTEDITTWNNTWKNRVFLSKDININDGNTLYIRNGSNKTIEIESPPIYGIRSNLNVKSSASVVIEENQTLHLNGNLHVTFEHGSELVLGDNSNIILDNSCQFTMNGGTDLKLGKNYNVKVNSPLARFIWKSTEVE